MKYRVLAERIGYPTDAAIIARLLAGENVPGDERGLEWHFQGAIVENVPACSVDDLLRTGVIEPADEQLADLGRADERDVQTIGSGDVGSLDELLGGIR